MASKKRRKPQPGPAAKRHRLADEAAAAEAALEDDADAPVLDDPGPAGDRGPLHRYRVPILLGLAAVGIAGALVVALSFGARDQYRCRAVDVPAGTTTAPSEREALDRLLAATPSLPTDGWAVSEPNRYSRAVSGSTMVVNISQANDGTWQAVRYDICGFNI